METSGDIKFVVGLGNPGKAYARTRHNIGFQALDALRRRWTIAEAGRAAFGRTLWDVRRQGPLGPQRVMLLEPMTYMNRSGQAVAALLGFYKAAPRDALIVLDDLALPPGQLRLRAEGSAGGQKGLIDILTTLGTDAVPRLRVGIGSPTPPMDAADYVLAVPGSDEAERLAQALSRAAEAIEEWVYRGVDRAMEKFNVKPRDSSESPEK